MKFYQKIIQSSREGGYVHESKKIAEQCLKLYPRDGEVQREYKYWKNGYWIFGEATRIFGIDYLRRHRLREWCQKSYDRKQIVFQDLVFEIDHPHLSTVILWEYRDILPHGMYYQDNKERFAVPNFSQKEFNGEGPYETESVQLHPDDIVIDCGANMGIFSILAVKRGVKTVYAFDPQERALRLLDTNIKSNNCNGKIIPVPFGLSDKKCSLSFVENADSIGASHISREGDTSTTTIECTTLDDWVAENNIPRIDFIKADIEGAERDMLNGARKTIKRDHPRLAICTYHLPDDPEVLRDIILSIDPSYNIDQRAKKLYAW